jgi:hypothetical protein
MVRDRFVELELSFFVVPAYLTSRTSDDDPSMSNDPSGLTGAIRIFPFLNPAATVFERNRPCILPFTAICAASDEGNNNVPWN